MMKKPVIELNKVWKVYQIGKVNVFALRGLDFKVYPGEFIAIMGKSGSGKSTLMNMIGCLDIPTKGHVYLDRKDISKLAESDLAQLRAKKIGFIFQTFNLLPTLSALENVSLPLIFQRIPKEEREEKAKSLLRMVGLGERMLHLPSELSQGEQQRVAIARALAVEPEIILADEPTGNLDTKTGKLVMTFIKKLHQEEKKTIIMVTHDPDIAKYAQKIEILKDGEILRHGK